ncbi:hypothetical protein GXB85_04155 [Cellulomonas sp. APG4]|uniref:hypothetical protein n=1 Tax=Cellulomonas sp. APG4 TaxID=1538656 RepID=UPI00137B1FC6|nr:hypothetical protein [Cellulomonas sp. APG4]NCT90146.1 hypothetical protein [Cellulomonas sp. APG4]
MAPTEGWREERYCAACDEEVTVHFTRIYQKNAAGDLAVDYTSAKCARGHEFQV